MKGFGIFVAVVLGCTAISVVAGTVLWRNYGPVVREALRTLGSDASDFASHNTQEACVPEALTRVEQCDGIRCQAEVRIFTGVCLRHASHSPDLCKDVPESLMQAALWPQTVCSEQDLPHYICVQIFSELTKTCLRRTEGD